MYDYWLGGHDNFAADRIAALKVTERTPGVAEAARANRAFLGRAVRYLAGEAGIRQFLDLGTGLPTKGNVHQVAQRITPGAHVVYVDNDPMVFAHARALKTGDGTAVIHADLRDPDTILNHPETRRLIDFSQPLAILFVSVLHFVPDPDARVCRGRLRQRRRTRQPPRLVAWLPQPRPAGFRRDDDGVCQHHQPGHPAHP